MASHAGAPVAVTGAGVISPIGIGSAPFAESLRAGRSGCREVAGSAAEALPYARACTVADFEPARFLGPKGIRVLDRTMAFAVVATGLALRDGGVDMSPESGPRVGLVLGTSNGSVKSTYDYTRETLVGKKAYLVSPELFPNTVMNGAAGQCAIWHGLRALNTTISGGRMAGLLALRYASRALRFGYAETIVAGAVEEFSAEMAWASYLSARATGEATPPLGEGCAMFLLETAEVARAAGRRVLAQVLSCETGVHHHDGAADHARALAGCVGRALERAGVAREQVWAVARRESGLTGLDAIEDQGLRLAFDGHAPARQLRAGLLVGECFSASGALQLAALLALFDTDEGRGRVGLVTSLAHGGGVGCAVVKAP